MVNIMTYAQINVMAFNQATKRNDAIIAVNWCESIAVHKYNVRLEFNHENQAYFCVVAFN